MTTPRDYSAMYDASGKCTVCGIEQYRPADGTHVARHLADGTAVVEKAFGRPDRVIPTSSLPVKDTADDPNPPTPKRLPRHAKPWYGKSYRKGA